MSARATMAATLGLALAMSFAAEAARADAEPEPAGATTRVALDLLRAQSIAVAAGERVVIRGLVRTSHDGVTYDAVRRYGDDGSTQLGGVLATDGVGLHVTRAERGVTELVATGEDAPLCRAAGLAPPCLVPRTASLAHERLLGLGELMPTLSGAMSVELPRPVAPPLVPPRFVAWTLGALLSLAGVLATLVLLHRLRTRPLARVRRAAAEARRGVRGLASAARLEKQIDALVAHAESLVRAEGELRARVARDEKRPATDRTPFAAREASERDRLRGERDRARARIEEIETALRVLALKAVRAEGSLTETEATLTELDHDLAIVDEAERETEAALAG